MSCDITELTSALIPSSSAASLSAHFPARTSVRSDCAVSVGAKHEPEKRQLQPAGCVSQRVNTEGQCRESLSLGLVTLTTSGHEGLSQDRRF